MHATEKKNTSLIWLIGALVSWAGIIIQLADMMMHRQQPVLSSLIKFFSYFTILTNLLVAIYFTSLLFFKEAIITAFCRKYTTVTALTIYILVVGLIYNLVLRQIWTFTGWGRISNELLHTITPFYFLWYWFFIVQKSTLPFRSSLNWTLYPLVYMVYTLIRGAILHTYPYPFIDVNSLGYSRVLINCIGVAGVFLVLFYVFIAIGNRLQKRRST